MRAGRAVLAGVAGGIAMTTLAWVVRQTGMDVNPEIMFGTMIATADGGAWLAGFAMHIVLSIVIALIYAWGFERVAHRAGIVVGLGFAVIHIIAAGLVMAMLPAIHPMIPEIMPAPGAFMSGMGAMGVGFFLLEHLLYGAIVGGVYGTVQHPTFAEPVPA